MTDKNLIDSVPVIEQNFETFSEKFAQYSDAVNVSIYIDDTHKFSFIDIDRYLEAIKEYDRVAEGKNFSMHPWIEFTAQDISKEQKAYLKEAIIKAQELLNQVKELSHEIKEIYGLSRPSSLKECDELLQIAEKFDKLVAADPSWLSAQNAGAITCLLENAETSFSYINDAQDKIDKGFYKLRMDLDELYDRFANYYYGSDYKNNADFLSDLDKIKDAVKLPSKPFDYILSNLEMIYQTNHAKEVIKAIESTLAKSLGDYYRGGDTNFAYLHNTLETVKQVLSYNKNKLPDTLRIKLLSPDELKLFPLKELTYVYGQLKAVLFYIRAHFEHGMLDVYNSSFSNLKTYLGNLQHNFDSIDEYIKYYNAIVVLRELNIEEFINRAMEMGLDDKQKHDSFCRLYYSICLQNLKSQTVQLLYSNTEDIHYDEHQEEMLKNITAELEKLMSNIRK